MAPPNLIAYSYGSSPYAMKIHTVLALAGIKDYKTVQVSAIMPRPELELIGVNYRRIPIMAAGKDVYCDSQAIIDYIVSISPKKLAGDPATDYAMKILGDTIFRESLLCFTKAAATPEFIKDREGVFKILSNPDLLKGKLRPHGLATLRSIFAGFEENALGKGKFIHGDEPTLADAHVAWAMHFALMRLVAGTPGLTKEDFPKLFAWLERFLEATKYTTNDISGEEAKKIILAGEFGKIGQNELSDDASGLKLGERVAINQLDADKTHPVVGKLVSLGLHEVVVEVDSGVRVHLPRIGQSVEKA